MRAGSLEVLRRRAAELSVGRLRSVVSYFGPLWLAVGVVLALSEVPWGAALRISAVLVGQTLVGVVIYRRLCGSRPALESLGVGLPIGASTWVLGDQLDLATIRSGVAPVMITGAALLSRACGCNPSRRVSVSAVRTSAGIFGIALMTLGVDWRWSFWVGATLVVISLTLPAQSYDLSSSQPWRGMLGAASVVVALLALARRPRGWWLNALPDTVWFEAFARGLAEFGPRGPGGIDLELRYHWFSYAWIGLTTRVSGVEPWLVLTRAAPLALGAALAAMVAGRAAAHSANPSRRVLVATAMLLCTSSLPIWFGQGFRVMRLESPSAVAGLVWLVAVMLVLDRYRASTSRPQLWLAAGLVAVTAMTKGPSGVVAGIAMLVAVLSVRGRRPIDLSRDIGAVAATATAVGVLYFALIRDSVAASLWSIRLGSFSFLWRLEADYLTFSRLQLAGLATIWFIGALGAPLVVVVCGLIRDRTNLVRLSPEIVTLVLAVGILAVIDVSGGESVYFLHAAWVLLIPAAVAIVDDVQLRDRRALLVAVLAAGVAVSLIAAVGVPPGATKFEIFSRDLPYLGIVLAMLIAVVGGYLAVERSRSGLIKIVALTATLFGSMTFVRDVIRETRRDLERDRVVDLAHDLDLGADWRELRDWIESTVPRHTVIATSIGDGACGSAFSSAVGCSDPLRSRFPYFALDVIAAELPHPMLLRASNVVARATGDSITTTRQEIARRRSSTLDFSRSATRQSWLTLFGYGVRFVIIERAGSPRETWDPFGRVVFENQTFGVVRLSVPAESG